MRAALLSPERERWAGSRDAGLRRRGGTRLGNGPRAGKRKGGSGPQGERERRERAELPEWISGRV